MVLELNDQVNIKGITIEEPEKRSVPFDPEKDITETDWQGMKDYARRMDKEPLENFTGYLENLKLLFPDRDLDIPVSGDMVQKRKEELSHTATSGVFHRLITLAESLKVISPDLFPLLDLYNDYNEQRRYIFSTRLDPLKQESATWSDFLFYYKAQKIAYNGYLDKSFLQESGDKKVKEWLTGMVTDEKSWFALIAGLADYKVLYPQEAAAFSLPPKVWQFAHNLLARNRQREDWQNFTALALRMKILAAKDVIVNKQGVSIIMPNQEAVKSPSSVPETRKF